MQWPLKTAQKTLRLLLCVRASMSVFFLIPQCELTSRPTGKSRLRVQWCKAVRPIFLSSTLPITIRAVSHTTTAFPLPGFTWMQCCIKVCIWEHNENWQQPDYNYPRTLSISVLFTLLSARGLLFLDPILLCVQMDSEHIWSGNWPSIWSTGAQQNWQHELVLLLGILMNFNWPDLTALRSLAKRFF